VFMCIELSKSRYRDPAAAKEALEKMNGFDLAGRPIRVGLGNDKFTNESTQNLLQRFPQQGSGVFGAGGRGTHAGGDVSYESKGRREDRGGIGNASALNDTDVGESNLANISRHEIMRKLLRADESSAASNGAASEKAKPAKAAPPPPKAPQASRCIVLSNVYDLAE
jgi:RNA-binding protein 39